jgi:hypothetical protein
MAFRILRLLEFETLGLLPIVGKKDFLYKVTDTQILYTYLNDAYIPNFEEFNEDVSLSQNSAWHLVTMPVEVSNRNVSILIKNSQGQSKSNGFRSVSSTQDRRVTVPSSGLFQIDVKVDANNQIEAYSSNRAQMDFTLLTARL